jgi:hypothetical protein
MGLRPTSNGSRDVGTGKHERFPWHADDAFVGAAPCGRWKGRSCGVCDVDADDGEVACFQFKDVGAAAHGGGLLPALVRGGTKSSDDFHNFFVLFVSVSALLKRIIAKEGQAMQEQNTSMLLVFI